VGEEATNKELKTKNKEVDFVPTKFFPFDDW